MLHQLRTLLDDPSKARAVMVTGESGIGKSRVVAELAREAAARGCRVLSGRCLAVAGDALPFAAMTEVVRSLVRDEAPEVVARIIGDDASVLSAIAPELAAPRAATADLVGSPHGRIRLFEAVRGTLVRAAADRPTLLVVEDVHLLSRTGVDLLRFLLHALPAGLSLVMTCRGEGLPNDAPLRALTTEVERAGTAELVELAPLTLDDVAEMVRLLRGVADPELARAVHERSGGNALFAEELIAAGADAGSAVPRRLHDVVLAQLQGLSRTAREVLAAVAVAGGTASHRLLVGICGLSALVLDGAVEAALGAGLLRVSTDGHGYEFRHVLVEQAIYDALRPGERERLHAACARAAEELVDADAAPAPTLVAAVADHYRAAGQSAASLSWSLRAATAWESAYAFHEALQQYHHALELWPHVSDAAECAGARRLDVLVRAARVADLVGDHGAARRLVSEALAEAPADLAAVERAALEERIAWYSFLGAPHRVVEGCPRAVALVAGAPPSTTTAQVDITHSRLLAMAGQAREALPVAQRALGTARALGSSAHEARALVSLGAAQRIVGEVAAAETTLREACDIAVAAADAESIGPAHVALSHLLLLWRADLTPAREFAASAHDRLARLGLERHVADFLLMHCVHDCYELGRWDECLVYADRCSAFGGWVARYAAVVSALVSAQRGGGRPSPDLELWWQSVFHDAPSLVLFYGQRLVELQLAIARPAHAIATVEAACTAVAGTEHAMFAGRLLTCGLRASADLVDAGQAMRDATLAAEASAAARRIERAAARVDPPPFDAARTPVVTAAADAASWDAERSRLAGSSDPQLWLRAAGLWREARRPVQTAYALFRAAHALAADRQHRPEAGLVLREAGGIADSLGARVLQRDLQSFARLVRLPSSRAHHRDVRAPARTSLLTAREVDVLRLLADGMTNRAIADALVLSPKTVDAHVTHLMHKLDVHDRVEAVERAHRLGLV